MKKIWASFVALLMSLISLLLAGGALFSIKEIIKK
jgi:hypothetical protein